jgi:membrane-bound ClpP family serine protease
MTALPLQVIDNFLLDYHIGHALVVVFALVILGSLPLRSRKVLALNLLLFGVIFMLVPFQMVEDVTFRLAGLGLVIVAPLLYVTADS